MASHAGRLGVRPVDLSSDDAFQYDRLAHTLLDEALFEYDHFVTVDRRRVNPLQWRHWRQDDDVVLYRERHAGDAALESLLDPEASGGRATARLTAFHDSAAARSKGKATPRLLAAGSLASSLDDVLYGIVTPSAAAMRLKAAHLKHDDFLDGAVLAQIRAPTPSEPFQFLGIKWLLQRGMGGGLVRPRDFVFLEASGVQVRQDGSGQRVGFHIMHSIDVPQCSPEGRGASVQRGAFSTCSLYHELANGVVDVYMTALVQPRGNLLAPLAMRSAAAMLTNNWRALTLFAENKKLAWMLETHRQLVGSAPVVAKHASRCGLCSKSFKGFTTKKSLACQLCAMSVCSHCSVTRTLRAEGFARDSIVATAMLFCKKCIALAGEENASEIARQQLWETEVVRTGRAHTQTALALVARREVNGSQLQPQSFSAERGFDPLGQASLTAYRRTGDTSMRATWHETDPGSRRYRIFDDKTGDANAPRASGSTRRRGTNGTWNDSARATDALSIGTMDYRSSSFQEPAPTPQDEPAEAGRASTASSALVLLDDRKSTRRMKALDYLPPVEASATTEETSSIMLYEGQSERASLATSSYTEIEVESVYSRSSFSSSIAVLDVDANRPDPSAATKPMTITEEEEPRSELEAFYHQQLKIHEQLQQQQQQQSSMIPLHPYQPTQMRSSRVHFQPETRPSFEESLLDVRTSEILPPPSTSSTLSRRNSGALAPERSSGEQRLSYQMQLWLQMNELRDTAESTYQIAQRNTEALASQNPKLFRDMRFFSQQPVRRTETSFAPVSLGPSVGTYQFGRRTSLPTTR